MVLYPHRPRMDQGRHPRGKIGYVLLASEQTIADEVVRLVPEGVGVHFSRVASADSITPQTLAAQLERLPAVAATLLPEDGLDVICYACTSGSFVIGEAAVCAALNAGAPRARATTLTTGVIRALRALAVERVVIGTPYVEPLNQAEARYFGARGFEVIEVVGLGLEHDRDMVRVTPEFLFEFGCNIDRPEAQAVFLSCGALRSLEVVEALERALGKPVVVSNQALIWDTLRLAGIDDRIDGFGRLLREH